MMNTERKSRPARTPGETVLQVLRLAALGLGILIVASSLLDIAGVWHLPRDIYLLLNLILLGVLIPAAAWFGLGWALRWIRAQEVMQQETRSSAQQLSALYAVDELTARATSLRHVLEQALDIVLPALKADAGGIYLRESEEYLRLEVHRGISPETAEALARIKIGVGISGLAVTTGRAVTLAMANYPTAELAPPLVRERFQFLASAPLLAGGQVVGALNVGRRHPEPFSVAELKLLASVAGQAGVICENARLVEQLSATAEQRAVLNRITAAISASLELEEVYQALVTELAKVFSFDRLSLSLLTAAGEMMELYGVSEKVPGAVLQAGMTFPLQDSALVEVVEKGKPLLRRDIEQEKAYPLDEALLQAGIRSGVALPLKVREKVLGTLNLGSAQAGAYSESDLEFLQPVANQLALAMEHSQLYQEVRKTAETNALLHHNSATLASLAEEEEILQELVRKTIREADADYSAVLLPDEWGETLYVAAEASRSEAPAQAIARALAQLPLRVGEGVNGQVFASGEPLLVEDYAALPGMPLPYVQAGIRSGFSVPLKVGGAVLGVLNATSFQPRRHSREQMTVAEIIAGHAATALASARLYRAEHQARLKLEELMVALQQRETELVAAYQSTAASLVFLLEARDPYTRGHSDRVRHYCRQMARLLRLSVMETASLDQAAQLHDLGKIGIPDHILRKPAALSPAEWAEVRLHPEKTVKLLELLPFLKEALPIIRSHHERWDGRGYPDNRANEDIPLGAQLLAVADAYDALTTARPYRPALSHEQAIEELRMGRGKQWSPLAVDTLLRVLTESSHPDVSD